MPSTPEEHQHEIDRLFDEILELDVSQRVAHLDQINCSNEVRQQVRALLAVHASADGKTEQFRPIADLNVVEMLPDEFQTDYLLGAKLGPYKITERIGSGGFGTVYKGVRSETFEKNVAIKIIRADRAASDEALRRFEVERQVLAELEHEGIARLLDGGCTDHGLPYIVMEYLDGKSITDYCDQNHATIDDRLRLFVRVCQAASHAHRFGVVHRDLKPENIMVTSEGTPKLVDFGIVKIVGQPDSLDVRTNTSQMPLTPAYASPEQFRGQPVSVASDVYSLGIVLYELLSGVHPFSFQGLMPHEVLKLLSVNDPTSPSNAVMLRSNITPSSLAETSQADEIAEQRSTSRVGLLRQLRGDLDHIVLKAIRKEPAHRYRSVDELCDDIERYQANLPVLARVDSFFYRVQSFARRHRAGMAACLLILFSMIVASGAVYSSWTRAEQSAKRYREQLYVSDMQIAFDAVQRNEIDDVQRILERYSNDAYDVPGFELALLHRFCRDDPPKTFTGHDGPVHEITNVPGAKKIVSVGEDATVRVWDSNTGNLLQKLGPVDAPLHSVAVSPDGRFVAAGNQIVTLWDLKDGQQVWQSKPFIATAESLAFSPDGSRLAIGERYEGVSIVSVANGEMLAAMAGLSRHDRLLFFPDGSLLAPKKVKHGNGEVFQRWSADFDELITEFEALGQRHMVVSPDYRWIASSNQNSVDIWFSDVNSGEIISKRRTEGDGVRSLALSADGSILATSHEDGKIRIWRVRTSTIESSKAGDKISVDLERQFVVQADAVVVPSMAFLEDGKLATCGSDGSIKVWPLDLVGGTARLSSLNVGIQWVSIGDGHIAVVDDQKQLWMKRKNTDDWYHVSDANEEYYAVSVSPNGSCVAGSARDGKVDLLDTKHYKTFDSFWPGGHHLDSVRFSRSGRLLAATGNDKSATLWSIPDCSLRHRFKLAGDGLAVSISPNEELLAVGGQFRKVNIYDVVKGVLYKQITLESKGQALAWSHDGRLLACGQRNGTILLYHLRDGRAVRMHGHRNLVGSLLFSTDGKTLISGGDTTIRIWNTSTARSMGILYQASKSPSIGGFWFSNDGKQFVAAISKMSGQKNSVDFLAWDVGTE